MRRRHPSKVHYRAGLHLAMKTQGGGYRPAVVLQDGGGLLVKVRYTLQGVVGDYWVPRADLMPPPWVGPRHS
jgi:hypothetical protein